MLVMYREFSKNPLYTLIRYLHDGCPILDFHHTRLIDHTRLLDTQEYTLASMHVKGERRSSEVDFRAQILLTTLAWNAIYLPI